MNKVNLVGLSVSSLESFMEGLGEPPFRGRQVYAWIYEKGAKSFDEMTDLPKGLRETLVERALLGEAEIVSRQVSADGTVKQLLRFPDGASVETVAMTYDHGVTACVSSQVGCRMGCSFCASGKDGFIRNLSPAEMLEELLSLGPVTHLVMMGTGEPLLNYRNVLDFLRFVHDNLEISFRRMTISTCGIVAGIRKLTGEGIPVTLALSLHAPDDATRSKIMPVARRQPLSEILRATRDYAGATGRRVTYEYALIEGLNDSPGQAAKLARILRGHPCHVNLIPLNPVEGMPYRPPEDGVVRRFAAVLVKRGIPTTIRRTLGADIDAACGQLRRKYGQEGKETGRDSGFESGIGNRQRTRPGKQPR